MRSEDLAAIAQIAAQQSARYRPVIRTAQVTSEVFESSAAVDLTVAGRDYDLTGAQSGSHQRLSFGESVLILDNDSTPIILPGRSPFITSDQ